MGIRSSFFWSVRNRLVVVFLLCSWLCPVVFSAPAGAVTPQVTAGKKHVLVLKSDGTLWGWGGNYYDQLGDGTTTDKTVPTRIGTDSDWVAAAAGRWHSLALKSDGSLWAWGSNENGQLGDGTRGREIHRVIPTPIGTDSDWSAIVAGGAYSLALKSDGSLWAWGTNYRGQLGDGTTTDKIVPTRIGTDADWTAIAADEYHSLALKSDGSLWVWGDNKYGQLGDGTSGKGTHKIVPTRVGADTDWSAIAAGEAYSLALKSDGTLWSWGSNEYGQLGDGTSGKGTHKIVPTQIGTDSDWSTIAAGEGHSLAIKSDGTLWVWGGNVFGQLGTGRRGLETHKTVPTRIGTDTDWTAIAAGGNYSLALKSDGSLWAWGLNNKGQLGNGTKNRTVPFQVGTDTAWTVIVAGNFLSLVLKSDGTLWAWGNNESGQLGDETKTEKTVPTPIGTDSDWEAIAAGKDHILALKSDGTLWVWGNNTCGQLGDGTSRNIKTIPTRIGAGNDWTTVAAGIECSLALKSDGTLWAWGYNRLGQLGDGTGGNYNKTVPTPIGVDTDWAAVAAGNFFSLALKTDGALWAWGFNAFGQLGDGTKTEKAVPTRIGSDTNWVAVAAGSLHSLALKSDGSLWAWGKNSHGQLGNGTSEREDHKAVPTRIGSDSDWIAIAAGGEHSAALKSDGTLWTWGNNQSGQLGDGTTISKATPVQVGTDTDWEAIAAGKDHSLALKSDGTLWSWGGGDCGQRGDGISAIATSPVQVLINLGLSN